MVSRLISYGMVSLLRCPLSVPSSFQLSPERLGELQRLRFMWLEVGPEGRDLDEHVIRDADYLANLSDFEYHNTVLQCSEPERYDRTPMGLLQCVLSSHEFYLHLHTARDQSLITRYLWHDLTAEEQRPFREFSTRVKSRGFRQALPWRDPTYELELPRLLVYPVPPPLLAVPYLRVLRDYYSRGARRVSVAPGTPRREVEVPPGITTEDIERRRARRAWELDQILAGRWTQSLPGHELIPEEPTAGSSFRTSDQ